MLVPPRDNSTSALPKRREGLFSALSSSVTALVLLCITFLPLPLATAQQISKVPRIGYLAPGSAVPDEFIQGLRELGYVEGQNIKVEPRFAHGKFDQFPRL